MPRRALGSSGWGRTRRVASCWTGDDSSIFTRSHDFRHKCPVLNMTRWLLNTFVFDYGLLGNWKTGAEWDGGGTGEAAGETRTSLCAWARLMTAFWRRLQLMRQQMN